MEREESNRHLAPAVSNEESFAMYRRTMDAKIARPQPLMDAGPQWSLHTQIAARWMARYSKRRDFIQGEQGWGHTLADASAVDALVARNLAREAAYPHLPNWDQMTLKMINQSLSHNYQQRRIDVSSLSEHCRFGPSLRRLWAEAQSRGLPEEQAWSEIANWAGHRPPVWDNDDARKRRKMSLQEVGAGPRLERQVVWQNTDDLEFPWLAEYGGERWHVRINDFPDEHMYTLFVNGEAAGDFDRWPDPWDRGDQQPAPAAKAVARPQTTQRNPAGITVKGRFLERYLAGEHETVWAELVALGPDVRQPKYLTEAVTVAREIMRRARHNVEVLIHRLDGMEYDFGDRRGLFHRRVRSHLQDPNVFLPPSRQEKAVLDGWEQHGLTLPLSLRIWMEEVGRVDLSGSHQALCFLDNGRAFPGVYADPLMVIPNAESLEDFLGLSGSENHLFISYDAWGKAAIGRNEQIDSEYSMEAPNLAVDGLLEGERHGINFVDYLRLSFRWGGFPGWEGQAQRPERQLATLTDGLLAL